MARGIFNTVFGAVNARRIFWIFLAWLALNLFFFEGFMGLNTWKFMGFSSIMPKVYGLIAGLFAIDVFRKAI